MILRQHLFSNILLGLDSCCHVTSKTRFWIGPDQISFKLWSAFSMLWSRRQRDKRRYPVIIKWSWTKNMLIPNLSLANKMIPLAFFLLSLQILTVTCQVLKSIPRTNQVNSNLQGLRFSWDLYAWAVHHQPGKHPRRPQHPHWAPLRPPRNTDPSSVDSWRSEHPQVIIDVTYLSHLDFPFSASEEYSGHLQPGMMWPRNG